MTHRRIHYIGDLYSKISNDATIGEVGGLDPSDPEYTLIGHDAHLEFPAGSRADHLFNGSLWVGGVVGNDTLVTEAVDGASAGAYEYNAFSPIEESYDLLTGQQTFEADYADTLILPFTSDEVALRLHQPLGLAITQKSHAFKTAPFDAFVIVEYLIRNISDHTISDAFVGIVADADILLQVTPQTFSGGPLDDLAGFLSDECIGYAIDQDGDPLIATPDTTWTPKSLRAGFALAPITITPTPTDTAFNWWAFDGSIDWGPSRDLATFGPVGVPFGDVNRYATMSNSEIDYDQLWSAVDMTGDGWGQGAEYPQWQSNLANGLDTRFLLSFGKYDLHPGDSIHAVFVLAAADSVHVSPTDFANHFAESDPQQFYSTLDFSGMKSNVDRARRVYELGFQLPSAPPSEFRATLTDDSTALCTWSPAPFETAIGYRLYRRELGSPFVLRSELHVPNSTYVDFDLEVGRVYEYGISSLDDAGMEGPISDLVTVHPGKPVVIPPITVRSISGRIRIDAEFAQPPAGFSVSKFLNIYRRPEGSDSSVIFKRFPWKTFERKNGGANQDFSRTFESARARSDGGLEMPSSDLPFVDLEVTSGIKYHYSASVTNWLGFEGDRSDEKSALAMAMDKKGLVLLHTSNAQALVLTEPDSIRSFYGRWATAHDFDTLTRPFNIPGNIAEQVTSLEALSHYKVVILVMEDDPARFPTMRGDGWGLYNWLVEYWRAGGRIVMIARNAGSNYVADNLVSRLVEVKAAVREWWSAFQSGGSFVFHSRFEGALSQHPEYPSLDGDSARVWGSPELVNLLSRFPGPHYLGGNVPAVGFVDSIGEGTEILYSFGSDFPDTSIFEGQVVGVKRITDSAGSATLFAFPLSGIMHTQAWKALSVAVKDLGGDTLWTSDYPVPEPRDVILQWLFSPTVSDPNPEWDLSNDGVVDIRDVVRSVSRHKPAPKK